jgi:hypothetical protein
VYLPTQLERMVNVMKGGGRETPAWANFTLLMECTPESSRCYSVDSVVQTVIKIYSRAHICKHLRCPGIDSASLCCLPGRYVKEGESISGLLKKV